MEFEKADPPATAASDCCGATGCCAIYEKPWVTEFLGESFHPGGIELTRRSIASLGLPKGARVLDVACGTGISAQALAESGYTVVGIDASKRQVETATARIGDSQNLSFVQSTAENIAKNLGAFDGVFCECAFSLVDDQAALAKSWADRLAPKGRLAISDMIVESELPASLTGEMGNLACLGNAQSANEYTRILEAAGFAHIVFENERDALLETLSMLKRKLLVFGVAHIADVVNDLGASLSDLKNALKDATQTVKSGALTYGRITATKS